MTHVAELFTSNTLSILRNMHLRQGIENDTPVVPDIYFSWDGDHGTTDLSIDSMPGQLGSVWGTVTGTPEWLSLNVSLGKASFTDGAVIGLILELEGCKDHRFSPFIRTKRDGTIEDTVFTDGFDGTEDRAVRTVLHTIQTYDPLSGEPGFHTLVIPLPRQDFELRLRDLRLIVIPAAQAAKLPTDGGFG